MPSRIPTQREDNRQGYAFLYFKNIIKVYSSMGKNSSFICSHTDSLTGAKKPVIWLAPVHLYRKWESVPRIKTKTVPLKKEILSCFMKITSLTVYVIKDWVYRHP